MRQYLPILLYAFFLLTPGAVRATTTLADEKIIANVGKHVELLVDSAHAWNIHQVTTSSFSAKFRPSQEVVPNLGYTRSAVWVRFTVKNLTFSDPWILQAA